MTKDDLSQEEWREYDFAGRTYRINRPVVLFRSKTGRTHRVLDFYGIVHCVPGVGQSDCVIRWEPKNRDDPVQF